MIKLELKVEEVQLVLNALSQLPYATSAVLIELIKASAELQLKEQNVKAVAQPTKDKTKQ
jgi:hypothetical protein